MESGADVKTVAITSGNRGATLARMSLLKVERLSRAYGAVRAVEEASFEVREGEIYGLLGPNGAGKATAISIIAASGQKTAAFAVA